MSPSPQPSATDVRIDALHLRLDGIEATRAPVIARLVAAALAARADDLTAGQTGARHMARVTSEPVNVDGHEPDAAIARRVAGAVVGSAQRHTGRVG